MRTLILTVVIALLLSGCSGVWMNAEYSQLLDKTAALSAETATRAEAGQLSEREKTQALTAQAQTWAKFKAARDGVK
jgi:uncharacterized protein YcfL